MSHADPARNIINPSNATAEFFRRPFSASRRLSQALDHEVAAATALRPPHHPGYRPQRSSSAHSKSHSASNNSSNSNHWGQSYRSKACRSPRLVAQIQPIDSSVRKKTAPFASHNPTPAAITTSPESHICQLHSETLNQCLDSTGTYSCKSFSPRCYIIQKVHSPPSSRRPSLPCLAPPANDPIDLTTTLTFLAGKPLESKATIKVDENLITWESSNDLCSFYRGRAVNNAGSIQPSACSRCCPPPPVPGSSATGTEGETSLSRSDLSTPPSQLYPSITFPHNASPSVSQAPAKKSCTTTTQLHQSVVCSVSASAPNPIAALAAPAGSKSITNCSKCPPGSSRSQHSSTKLYNSSLPPSSSSSSCKFKLPTSFPAAAVGPVGQTSKGNPSGPKPFSTSSPTQQQQQQQPSSSANSTSSIGYNATSSYPLKKRPLINTKSICCTTTPLTTSAIITLTPATPNSSRSFELLTCSATSKTLSVSRPSTFVSSSTFSKRFVQQYPYEELRFAAPGNSRSYSRGGGSYFSFGQQQRGITPQQISAPRHGLLYPTESKHSSTSTSRSTARIVIRSTAPAEKGGKGIGTISSAVASTEAPCTIKPFRSPVGNTSSVLPSTFKVDTVENSGNNAPPQKTTDKLSSTKASEKPPVTVEYIVFASRLESEQEEETFRVRVRVETPSPTPRFTLPQHQPDWMYQDYQMHSSYSTDQLLLKFEERPTEIY